MKLKFPEIKAGTYYWTRLILIQRPKFPKKPHFSQVEEELLI